MVRDEETDIVVHSFIPKWKGLAQPARLRVTRKWLNVTLAHLTTHRTDPAYKAGEITGQIWEHTKAPFEAFVAALSDEHPETPRVLCCGAPPERARDYRLALRAIAPAGRPAPLGGLLAMR